MNWNTKEELFNEYLWVVGLGIIVGGILKLKEINPWGIIILGLFIACIGVWRHTKANSKQIKKIK